MREEKKVLAEEDMWSFSWELCSAIKYLHENNIMHRDIKTANIFLTKNKKIKVFFTISRNKYL